MMNASLFRRFPCVLFATLAFVLSVPSHAQSVYAIIDLDTLTGRPFGEGFSINASGQVAGIVSEQTEDGTNDSFSHAVLWTGIFPFAPTDLTPSGADQSYARAINNSGQIAGYFYSVVDGDHAFLYSDATITDFGIRSMAYGINVNSHVAGLYERTNLGSPYTINHASFWIKDIKGNLAGYDLGALGDYPDFTESRGYALNDSDQIVGQSSIYEGSGGLMQGPSHACLWTLDSMNIATIHDLGTLDPNNNQASSYAFAINSSRQIVGYSTSLAGTPHAFRYSGMTMTDLGTLGGQESYAFSINSSGMVVGYTVSQKQQVIPFIATFIPSGPVMVNLNNLLPTGSGWELQDARSINDNGWITGYGIINGQQHAYILKPNGAVVTGRIVLEGVRDLSAVSPYSPLGTFHISFRTPGTTNELYGYDVTLTTTPNNSVGNYIVGVPTGTYDVAIKGHKNLRVAAASNLVISGVTGTIPDVLLPAGDANNDNFADTSDFGVLIGAYGADSNITGSGYDQAADFNFDGIVDTTDFGLLVGEYGNQGVP